MKLAAIHPDATAHCFLCRWSFKMPFKRRVVRGEAQEVSPQERAKLLEEVVVGHLREAHDRLLLSKDERPPDDEGMPGKVYYLGRR